MTELAHWRMHNLRLSGPALPSPEEVVRWLGAVQSQDYGPAKWSLGARTRGASDAGIDEAFAAGTVLRTHVLRPTWHFVTPEDIGWLLKLTAPRVHALNAHYYRQLGLDESIRKRAASLLAGALSGGNRLTRKELDAVLTSSGMVTDGVRLGYLLMSAELDAVICSGGLRGRQHTYALLDERARQARSLDRDEALAELARRYFAGHGPATANDFRWWSSLTAADARRAIELATPPLRHADVEGLRYWFAGRAPVPVPASPTVHLLQTYDEYVVGYRDSRYVLDASGVWRSSVQSRGTFNPVVVLDGQVAGHWRRTLRGDSVLIEVTPHRPFDDAERQALREAADRYGEFLGLSATVVTS